MHPCSAELFNSWMRVHSYHLSSGGQRSKHTSHRVFLPAAAAWSVIVSAQPSGWLTPIRYAIGFFVEESGEDLSYACRYILQMDSISFNLFNLARAKVVYRSSKRPLWHSLGLLERGECEIKWRFTCSGEISWRKMTCGEFSKMISCFATEGKRRGETCCEYPGQGPALLEPCKSP